MKLPVVEFYYFPLQLGVYFDAVKKKHLQDTENIIVKGSFFHYFKTRKPFSPHKGNFRASNNIFFAKSRHSNLVEFVSSTFATPRLRENT